MTRRCFLAALARDDAAPRHVLPGATHDRIRLKVSYPAPRKTVPVLRVGGQRVSGEKTDTDGQFWAFNATGLKPETAYRLALDGGEPWTLKTLPAPGATVERFRVLVYTCAGGHEAMPDWEQPRPYFVPVRLRRKLFENALAHQPDAAIAIGDHVYWDLRYGRASGRLPMGQQEWARRLMGGADFDRALPVLGTPNEARLKGAVDGQIAELYGTLFRSTPVQFIQDDHDYFENDEAHPAQGVSFPPDDFMTRLARATQRLYFPEHLESPPDLPSAGECYGTLRVGQLAELLLFDCRRHQTLQGPGATLVPPSVEAWIADRWKTSPVRHVVNVPSMPIGWSAGKWGEWYPDVLDANGRLGVAQPKYFWQEGWRLQHDRLLAMAANTDRVPLFISGDLHALAHGAIRRSGALRLPNPVQTILSGPVSTGPRGWPSAARGTPPLVPDSLEIQESLAPLEHNGFTLLDFTRNEIKVRQFRWKLGRDERELEGLKPFHEFVLARL